MTHLEWPADDYAIGAFIQSTISDQYLNALPIKPTDKVLDIGCGDGSYSLKVLKHYQVGSYTAADASENMLALARKTITNYSNCSFKQLKVDQMDFNNEFDCIITFWCLQWVKNIETVLQNIYHALKEKGHFFALLPSGDDPFIDTFNQLKASHRFKSLDNFKTPVNYSQFQTIEQKAKALPFKNLRIERSFKSLLLPSLETFRKFVTAIPFYQGQIQENEIKDINEAMVQLFDQECQQRFAGEYRFEFTVFTFSGEK